MQRDARVDKVIEQVRAIPRGSVMSYGEVARRAGLPGRARWVGRVLRDVEVERLPWHRVLRADGRPGFPEGSPQWSEQRNRLEEEGVRFRNGRVPAGAFQRVEDTLDALLWGGPDPGAGGA